MSNPAGGGDDPFANMGFLGDLAKMLRQQGPIAWDAATQLAHSIAAGDTTETNVEPTERIAYEQLARVAELQVTGATGLPAAPGGRPVTVTPVTRTQWTSTTIEDFRPLLERLAEALKRDTTGSSEATELDPAADPAGSEAMLGNLMSMLGPVMLGMASGSMVGHLAVRSFGQYDLPMPRPRPEEVMVVAPSVTEFGQAWSLDLEDLRLWVCLHEISHHTVLSIPHVRARLTELVGTYLSAFEPDTRALEERMGDLDMTDLSDMAGMQKIFTDPELLLGAMRTPAQTDVLGQLEALTTVVVGYVDHIMDRVGSGLISSYQQVTEALRRRRVEASDADRFTERLFGLSLDRADYERGRAFIDGVVERSGTEALERLWRDPEELPTPSEVDAPGLWLARIDLPDA